MTQELSADEREALIARLTRLRSDEHYNVDKIATLDLAIEALHLHPQPIQHAWIPGTGPDWVPFCGDPDAKPLDPPPATAAESNAIPMCTLCHKKAMRFARKQERAAALRWMLEQLDDLESAPVVTFRPAEDAADTDEFFDGPSKPALADPAEQYFATLAKIDPLPGMARIIEQAKATLAKHIAIDPESTSRVKAKWSEVQ